MCKRGNYFIAMYDKYDNYVRDFESIEECARYFQTTYKNVQEYIFRKKHVKNEYRLFKINEEYDQFNNYKSL